MCKVKREEYIRIWKTKGGKNKELSIHEGKGKLANNNNHHHNEKKSKKERNFSTLNNIIINEIFHREKFFGTHSGWKIVPRGKKTG
jgi:hypothetical protein